MKSKPASLLHQKLIEKFYLKEITDEFLIELLKSERKRVLIILCIFIGSFIIFPVASAFWPQLMKLNFVSKETIKFSIIWSIIFFLFELIVFIKINYHLRAKKRVSPLFRIPNVLVEFILPSIFIYAGIKYDNNFLMLDADGFLFYVILIVLSSLHLDFKVSLFAGIVAFLTFFTLFWWGFGHIYNVNLFDFSDTTLFQEKMVYTGRSVSLLGLGIMAGFVANEMQLRLKAYLSTQRERQQIERLFGQQVSKEVVDELIKEKEQMDTKYVDASIMFLDIRDFTTFAGHTEPSEVIHFQNTIFSPLIEIITNYNGIVLQILGDGFMAAFGAPVKDKNHSENAFNAGISIIKKIEEMSFEHTIHETKVGIGLHTGKIITGNIGNNIRQQYSIAGKNVIMAARLEQANKIYKTNFLLSQEVHDKIRKDKQQFRKIQNVALKGFDDKFDIYSVENVHGSNNNYSHTHG